MTTTLGLIRHGLTQWNAEGRLQGQIDIELSEQGVQQANALAMRLQGEDWDIVISSDLRRAQATAHIIAKQLGITEVHTDQRLRERAFGLLEGTTLDERITRWGNDWASLDLQVESDEQLIQRAMNFIEEVVLKHSHQRILIVSHGGYLALLYKTIFEEHQDEHVSNTSFTIAEYHEGQYHKRLFNCTTHLNPEDLQIKSLG